MSSIDPVLLRGLSQVQPNAKARLARDSGQSVPGFDKSLDALLRTTPANDPIIPHGENGNTEDISFSKHANNRLVSRGIEVSADERKQLATAVDELSQRGAKESLVLMNDRAYVVGVPKRTVITVMSRDEALGQVFTNIDSTFVAM